MSYYLHHQGENSPATGLLPEDFALELAKCFCPREGNGMSMSRNQLGTREGRRRRRMQDEISRSEAQQKRAELIERTKYVAQREKLYPDQDGLAPGERTVQLIEFLDGKFAEVEDDD